jgi:myo-inositol-1(or 4)-monophosphatase
MNPTVADLLRTCQLAAEAGAEQLKSWRGRVNARDRARRALVTDADLASERAVRGLIGSHFPEHGILGEEAPDPAQLDREYCWVVDPLDGTLNYAHGLPCYAVSVAVVRRGRLLAGVVLDPERDECFAASAETAAELNGQPARTSHACTLGEALTAVSFPTHVTDESRDLLAFLRTAPRCQAVRRTGSAALNLAYVARGRLDAHWAHEIHSWDAAAGVLLVQQAGGVVTAADGAPFDISRGAYLAAATPELHAALLPLVR